MLPDLEDEARRVHSEWISDHESEGLQQFGAMVDALQGTFGIEQVTWHPYLYWDLAADIMAPDHELSAAVTRLRNQEFAALEDEVLAGTLFATTGHPR